MLVRCQVISDQLIQCNFREKGRMFVPREGLSLQEKYAPQSACFGCGPANEKGLQVKTYIEGDQGVALWRPEPHHVAFPGVLNGGIIGSVLDCHSNWTAAWFLMRRAEQVHPPCTVTAEYSIQLIRPTPTEKPIQLLAIGVEMKVDRAVISATLSVEGRVCALCKGTFVAVKPGHPAYHRW